MLPEIHFADATASVVSQVLAAIAELYQNKQRVIVLTGHSLGGSLATLCALDVVLSLGVSSKEVVVSTFGSPRIGNGAFRKFYSTLVPTHWRLELAPDMVTRLPLLMYKHVGKRVSFAAHFFAIFAAQQKNGN